MLSASDSRRSSELLALSHVSQQSQDSHHATLPDRYEVCQPFAPRAYRISDVCKITGLGRTTIYAAIKSGDLIARNTAAPPSCSRMISKRSCAVCRRPALAPRSNHAREDVARGMQPTKRISNDAAV